jgi:monoamine oxidase
MRTELLFVDGRRATELEQAGYDQAWEGLDAVVAPALAGPDRTLAEAMAPMRGDPWAATVATWEGAIIAGADADELGVRDWKQNALHGRNLQPAEGIGAFVARRLAGPAWLEAAVTRVGWGGAGVVAETRRGDVRAAAAVVTVSTGVLASGAIRFDPPLPALLEGAIHRLPMGLLTKIGLYAPERRADGIIPNSLLVRRDGRMTFNAWPQARPYVTGFVGGRLAWSLAEDEAAALALAREELRAMVGGAIGATGPALVTRWGTDQWHRGAYAFARPGDADQRGVLADAFPGERLLFAGEACRTDGLAGTVAGAYLAGQDAAERLLAREAG